MINAHIRIYFYVHIRIYVYDHIVLFPFAIEGRLQVRVLVCFEGIVNVVPERANEAFASASCSAATCSVPAGCSTPVQDRVPLLRPCSGDLRCALRMLEREWDSYRVHVRRKCSTERKPTASAIFSSSMRVFLSNSPIQSTHLSQPSLKARRLAAEILSLPQL